MFLEIREMLIPSCPNTVKNYNRCHQGPTISVLSEDTKQNKKPENKNRVKIHHHSYCHIITPI